MNEEETDFRKPMSVLTDEEIEYFAQKAGGYPDDWTPAMKKVYGLVAYKIVQVMRTGRYE